MLSLQFCGRSHHPAAATATFFANPYKTNEISTFLTPKSSFCYIINAIYANFVKTKIAFEKSVSKK